MSVQKSLKKKLNKTKEEIVSDIQQAEKIKALKQMVSDIYPFLVSQKTIYDAQTVVNALSGFIAAHVQKKVLEIKLGDLPIDLSKEEDSEIKEAILKIMRFLRENSAQEVSETLEKFGRALSQYSANEYMKQPMKIIKLEDLVAK